MPRIYASAEQRFWKKVVDSGGCWDWTGAKMSNGYGTLTAHGKHWYLAHRFAYELLVGPIPDGLQIDHLCRNRLCVNPDHLEAVSMRENILRGHGAPASNARKTHCPNGHPLSGGNLRRAKDGSRKCRTCNNLNTWRRKK